MAGFVTCEAKILYDNKSATSVCKFYEGTTSEKCKIATWRMGKHFLAACFIATTDEPRNIRSWNLLGRETLLYSYTFYLHL